MNKDLYSRVHFFETLRDIVVSQPYAILCCEEVNSLIAQIDNSAKYANAQYSEPEDVCALRQAVENARSDGYFPIVILPFRKYEAALSNLGVTQM
jgi:hypothetical protein